MLIIVHFEGIQPKAAFRAFVNNLWTAKNRVALTVAEYHAG